MTEHLTTLQRSLVAEQLRKAKATIEAEQEAPLDVGQACTIYDLCTAMMIKPVAVLDDALNLIDPDQPEPPPLLELLGEDPQLLAEIGQGVSP